MRGFDDDGGVPFLFLSERTSPSPSFTSSSRAGETLFLPPNSPTYAFRFLFSLLSLPGVDLAIMDAIADCWKRPIASRNFARDRRTNARGERAKFYKVDLKYPDDLLGRY